ncbi:hypothetical protein [Fischerella thermalis]|uniref:hypothetical protein n=1 Tax=Fischerella thermalis TaxID=372787 RepID=UPI0011AF0F79|nr:hypothetical protein [Fischerella thermalis]
MVVIADCDRSFFLTPLLSLRPLRFKFFIKNRTIRTTTWSFAQNLALWGDKKERSLFPNKLSLDHKLLS